MAAGDLTSLARVKQFLKIDLKDSDDQLEFLISAASKWFKSQVKRDFTYGTYTDTYRLPLVGGPRQDRPYVFGVSLKNTPIESITSVMLDGYEVLPQTSLDQPGYKIDIESGRVELVGVGYLMSQAQASLDPGQVQVVYVGGYTVIPFDVEQVIVQLVAWRFKERDRIGQSSKNLKDENVTFMTTAAPADALLVVDMYRRPSI